MTDSCENADLVVDDDFELRVPLLVEGRVTPVITPESEPFWRGLERGKIVLSRCAECNRRIYPPTGGCPWCGGETLVSEETHGRGELYSFTVCYAEFGKGVPTPYVVGVVCPYVDPGIRIVTNIVGCRISQVRIDMPVDPLIVRADSGSLLFYVPSGKDQGNL